MKYEFIYGSFDYQSAVNYDGTNYYNPPILLSVNNALFILPFGTSDKKNVRFFGNDMYIVAENSSLNYISMVCIDLTDNSIVSCYLSDNDLSDTEAYSYGLLDKDTNEQIDILVNYL